MQITLRKENVNTYEGDLCFYDLKQANNGEELMVKKPIRFMTNADEIGKEPSQECKGLPRHIELTGGSRAKRVQVYPDKQCRAIVRGIINQMAKDERYRCSSLEEKKPNTEIQNDHYEINE